MNGVARRCFLACFPDADGRAALAALRDALRLRVDAPNVRWLPEERWHATLVFLGSLTPAAVAALLETLADALDDFVPIRCATRGAMYLPHPARPRTLAVGIDSAGALERTAEIAAAAVDANGIARERRAFLPHLTLARLKRGPARLAGEPPEPVELTFGHVGLYESRPRSEGPRYLPIWQRP